MPSLLNDAFMRFTRRAEVIDRAELVETFVDAGPLLTLLGSRDHQVVYGRRGTGKTHALSYLVETRIRSGDLAVYIDLRNIGSTGGLYSDADLPLTERGTRLLIDTLAAIHDSLMDRVLEREGDLNLAETGPSLDRLGEALTEVAVVGSVVRETAATEATGESRRRSIEARAATSGASLMGGASSSGTTSHTEETRAKESGLPRHRVQFGPVRVSLEEFRDAVDGNHVWIILDEWSSIPFDLQPYLADFLRRSVMPIRGYTIKIGAIEQRSRFRIPSDDGDYIGLELGADIAADVNLDDFMVFENDSQRAKAFFQELLFKHFIAIEQDPTVQRPANPEQLIRDAFTQVTAFEEFIRAAEGVPRDAINVIGRAAQRALDDPISVNHVRAAAKTWYQRDKEAAVNARSSARDLLHWIIDKVIGERRARAFLLQSDESHTLIDWLFDSRVLHILKRSVSAPDRPGIRYDVYKLDYGCYVDLISTARAPQGLLPLDQEVSGAAETEPAYIDVPPDDYRSIRRAILDLAKFERNLAESR